MGRDRRIGWFTYLEAFITRLQAAVRADNPDVFAELVHFPLKVNGDHHPPLIIRSSHDLVRRFHGIVTPAVRRAILAQDPDSVFRNWQGYMIGDGEVWFDEGCDYAIDAPICFSIRVINLAATGLK